MDLDCTDAEWAEFIKQIEAIGAFEIEQMVARQKAGTPEPPPAPPIDGSMLYYWQHLMGEGDGS